MCTLLLKTNVIEVHQVVYSDEVGSPEDLRVLSIFLASDLQQV